MRQTWQLWEGIISPDMCNKYIEDCKKECVLKEGDTFSASVATRQTQIGWIYNPALIELTRQYTEEANRNAFNVDISYIPAIQFGEYTQGSYYGWHHDIDWTQNNGFDRKLSVVVQLSDPDDYEGGVFQFKEVESPASFSTQGSILVFPSYLTHQVTEVTQGTRYSLVCWAEGSRWR